MFETHMQGPFQFFTAMAHAQKPHLVRLPIHRARRIERTEKARRRTALAQLAPDLSGLQGPHGQIDVAKRPWPRIHPLRGFPKVAGLCKKNVINPGLRVPVIKREPR